MKRFLLKGALFLFCALCLPHWAHATLRFNADKTVDSTGARAYSLSVYLTHYEPELYLPATVYENGESYTISVLKSHGLAIAVNEDGEWYTARDNFGRLILPDSIYEIQREEIEYCSQMTYLRLPKQLDILGEFAIANNPVLETVDLPTTGPAVIGAVAFASNPKLRALNGFDINPGIITIGNGAFRDCTSLQGRGSWLPPNVVEIGNRAFQNCTSLASLNTQQRLNTIGTQAFEGCTGLKSLRLNAECETVGSSAFKDCTALEYAILPRKMATFPIGLFDGCSSLQWISVGAETTKIDGGLFGCTALRKVLLRGTVPADFNWIDPVYNKLTRPTSVLAESAVDPVLFYLPEHAQAWEAAAKPSERSDGMAYHGFELRNLNSSFITNHTLYTVLDDGTVRCDRLFAVPDNGVVTIPETVEGTVGDVDAGLGITRTYTVTEIGANCFSGKLTRDYAKIRAITLPQTIRRLGAYAFCQSPITQLEIPEAVSDIGEGCFYASAIAGELRWPRATPEVPALCCYACPALEELVLPEGVRTLGDKALSKSAIRRLTLPASVEALGCHMAESCEQLREVDLSASQITALGYYAFGYCPRLFELKLPHALTNLALPYEAFAGCTSLTRITFPATVEKWSYQGDKRLLSYTYEGLPGSASGLVNGYVPVMAVYYPPELEAAWTTEQNLRRWSSVVLLPNLAEPNATTTLVGEPTAWEFSRYGFPYYTASVETDAAIVPDFIDVDVDEATGEVDENGAPILERCRRTAYVTGVERLNNRATTIRLPFQCQELGARLFYGASQLRTLTFPASLQTIGAQAFEGCGVQSYALPGPLTLGSRAFANTPAWGIYLGGEKPTSLGEAVFTGSAATLYVPAAQADAYTAESAADGTWQGRPWTTLEEASLQGRYNWGWISQGESVFLDSATKAVVDVPGGTLRVPGEVVTLLNGQLVKAPVVALDDSLFSCYNFAEVILPETLTDAGSRTFSGCPSLRRVVLPEGIVALLPSLFASCSALEEVVLPPGLLSIYTKAFAYCSALTTISLPESVSYVADDAFYATSALREIVFNGPPPRTFPTCAAGFAPTLVVPEAYREAWEAVLDEQGLWFGHAPKFPVKPDLRWSLEATAGDTASLRFMPVGNETSLRCPSTYTYAGRDYTVTAIALAPEAPAMPALAQVTLPSGLTTLGDGFFAGCAALEEITLPASLRALGASAFRDCAALRAINLEQVARFGAEAFGGCAALEEVTLGSSEGRSALSLGSGLFRDCAKLAKITLRQFPTEGRLPAQFAAACALRELELPAGITALSTGAFADNAQLTRVILPEGFASLSADAFSGCPALRTLDFRGGVPTCEQGATLVLSAEAVGSYTEAYAEAWQAALDAQGKWAGLTMKPSYALPQPPADCAFGRVWVSRDYVDGVTLSTAHTPTEGSVLWARVYVRQGLKLPEVQWVSSWSVKPATLKLQSDAQAKSAVAKLVPNAAFRIDWPLEPGAEEQIPEGMIGYWATYTLPAKVLPGSQLLLGFKGHTVAGDNDTRLLTIKPQAFPSTLSLGEAVGESRLDLKASGFKQSRCTASGFVGYAPSGTPKLTLKIKERSWITLGTARAYHSDQTGAWLLAIYDSKGKRLGILREQTTYSIEPGTYTLRSSVDSQGSTSMQLADWRVAPDGVETLYVDAQTWVITYSGSEVNGTYGYLSGRGTYRLTEKPTFKLALNKDIRASAYLPWELWSSTSIPLEGIAKSTKNAITLDLPALVRSQSAAITGGKVRLYANLCGLQPLLALSEPFAAGTQKAPAVSYLDSDGSYVYTFWTAFEMVDASKSATLRSWRDDGSSARKRQVSFAPFKGQRTFVADYGELVAVTLRAQGEGTVSGGGNYANGAKVSLKATPKRGYTFAGWFHTASGEPVTTASGDYRLATLPYFVGGQAVDFTATFIPTPAYEPITLSCRDTSMGVGYRYTITPTITSRLLPKVSVKGLPSGLKWDASANAITGSPTKPGAYTVTLSATNAACKTPVTATFTCWVFAEAPAALFTDGRTTLGCTFVAGRAASYTLPVVPGATLKGLPAGLTYDSASCALGGLCMKPGSTVATLSATVDGRKLSGQVVINVAPFEAPTITTFSLPEQIRAGAKLSGQAAALSNVDDGKAVTLKASGLPTGVKFDAKTGAFSGTPTKPGTYTVTLTATNSGRATATERFTLTILPNCYAGTYLLFLLDAEADSLDQPCALQATLAADGKLQLTRLCAAAKQSLTVSGGYRYDEAADSAHFALQWSLTKGAAPLPCTLTFTPEGTLALTLGGLEAENARALTAWPNAEWQAYAGRTCLFARDPEAERPYTATFALAKKPTATLKGAIDSLTAGKRPTTFSLSGALDAEGLARFYWYNKTDRELWFFEFDLFTERLAARCEREE